MLDEPFHLSRKKEKNQVIWLPFSLMISLLIGSWFILLWVSDKGLILFRIGEHPNKDLPLIGGN
jgi:hypothetical protein